MTREIKRIQLRRGSTVLWTSANPVLAPGEMGIDLTTFESRIGDGVTNWLDLPRATDAATNAAQTAADRVQTGLDRVATGQDALLSQAWAESPTPPDPENPDSKSSKTWADVSQSFASGAFFFVSETDTLINLVTNPNTVTVTGETDDTYTLEVA